MEWRCCPRGWSRTVGHSEGLWDSNGGPRLRLARQHQSHSIVVVAWWWVVWRRVLGLLCVWIALAMGLTLVRILRRVCLALVWVLAALLLPWVVAWLVSHFGVMWKV